MHISRELMNTLKDRAASCTKAEIDVTLKALEQRIAAINLEADSSAGRAARDTAMDTYTTICDPVHAQSVYRARVERYVKQVSRHPEPEFPLPPTRLHHETYEERLSAWLGQVKTLQAQHMEKIIQELD